MPEGIGVEFYFDLIARGFGKFFFRFGLLSHLLDYPKTVYSRNNSIEDRHAYHKSGLPEGGLAGISD